MTMLTHPARICSFIVIALAILTMISATPVSAQQLGPDGAPNPTASVASEQQLLQQSPRIKGLIDQPNERERVLMQPAGRQWDYFHEVILHWLGAIVILGMIVALGAAYLIMGRLRMFFPATSRWTTLKCERVSRPPGTSSCLPPRASTITR